MELYVLYVYVCVIMGLNYVYLSVMILYIKIEEIINLGRIKYVNSEVY